MSQAPVEQPAPAVEPDVELSLNKKHMRRRWTSMMNAIMFTVCVTFAIIILSLLALVTGYLIYNGVRYINLSLFTADQIPPGMPGFPGGLRNAIVGTGGLILLASLIGVPVGMLAGVFLAEYDRPTWLAAPARFVADVLAGVPSIVVGILGYELIVVPIGNYNGYAGALALAFIMIPIITRTTEEMLRLVPQSYREASVALGATNARTIVGVVVPAAAGSIVTGIMLAIARVAGETAPLLFTALGSRFLPVFRGPAPYVHPQDLSQPFPSLTVQIFDYATGPFPERKQQAWAGMLVLVVLIFILNLSIRYFTNRAIRKAVGAG